MVLIRMRWDCPTKTFVGTDSEIVPPTWRKFVLQITNYHLKILDYTSG